MELTSTRIAGDQIHGRKSIDVKNPFNGEVVGKVPDCGADEVDRACRSAQRLLDHSIPPQHARAAVLLEAARRMAKHAHHHAHVLALESGKPIRDARAEVKRCVDTLHLSAVEATKLNGEMVPMDATASGAGRLGFAMRVPIGVVGAITPFNFPLNLVAHKLGPAIAAGCPVVLKPASKTPLSAIEFVEVLVASGLPERFISVVTGTKAGDALVRHPIPKLMTFTGSAAVGMGIAQTAFGKRVRLELGSNAPLIIAADADIDEVARLFAKAAFGYAGQSCISVQRVLCHASIRDKVRDTLVAAAEALVLGDPLDESTDLGPMITPRENDRVTEWVEEAKRGGGRLLTGGSTTQGIFRPTLVEDTPMDARLWKNEVFGPVASLRSFENFDEAIAIANDTTQPLQAGVFTRDIGRALDAAKKLHFGGVVINDMPSYRADQQPYGGEGEAGNTREGPSYATAEMTTLRFVSLRA